MANHGQSWTMSQVKKVLSMSISGITTKEISERIDCTYHQVLNITKYFIYNEETHKKKVFILPLLAPSESRINIAKKFGVSCHDLGMMNYGERFKRVYGIEDEYTIYRELVEETMNPLFCEKKISEIPESTPEVTPHMETESTDTPPKETYVNMKSLDDAIDLITNFVCGPVHTLRSQIDDEKIINILKFAFTARENLEKIIACIKDAER